MEYRTKNQSKMVLIMALQRHRAGWYTSREIAAMSGLSYAYCRQRCRVFASWRPPILRESISKQRRGRPVYVFQLAADEAVKYHLHRIRHTCYVYAKEHLDALQRERVEQILEQTKDAPWRQIAPASRPAAPVPAGPVRPGRSGPSAVPDRQQRVSLLVESYRRLFVLPDKDARTLQRMSQIEDELSMLGMRVRVNKRTSAGT